LCKALKGDYGQAQQLIAAASYRERSGHGRAVVLFNEALIQLKQGDEAAALGKLVEAVKLSPTAIKQYCRKSVHCESFTKSSQFAELLADA
jgi:hypothetical protein